MAEQSNTQLPRKLSNLNVAASGPLKLGVSSIFSFISPALGWALSHWKLALGLILCFIIFVQYELIKHYKAETKADDTAITILTDSLTKANKAINDQNQGILDAQKTAEAQQKQLDDLNIQLVKKRASDQKTIDALRKKNAGTTCVDALKFIQDNLGVTQWPK